MQFAQIVVKQRTNVSELTYSIPAHIIPYIRVGSLVEVPLKRGVVEGVVVSFSRNIDQKWKDSVKEIQKIIRSEQFFSSEQISVVKQIASTVSAELAEVAFHALKIPASNDSKRLLPKQPLVVFGPRQNRLNYYLDLINRSESQLYIFALKDEAKEFFKSLPSAMQKLAVLDDGRTASDKKITAQQSKIIIGTLSTIFTPLVSGSLLIIDQYRHAGNKSDQRPFLTAKTIGQIRARVEGLELVLGESVIHPIELSLAQSKLLRAKHLPSVEKGIVVIDQKGQSGVIATTLLESIFEGVGSKHKQLILTYSKGVAPALICQECGAVVECAQCHRTISVQKDQLVCRFCAHSQPSPQSCAKCRSETFYSFKTGSLAIKNLLASKFPAARVAEYSSEQPEFDDKADIIVATEKIFSLPNVRFDSIYVIDPDRLLSGAQIDGLWRLAGQLVELNELSKTLYVQTHHPDASVWGSVSTKGLKIYLSGELSARKQLSLPPFGSLFSIVGSGNSSGKLSTDAFTISSKLQEIDESFDISPLINLAKRGSLYRGKITVLSASFISQSKMLKIRSLIPPAWHLDID